jgi:hypothetical protein
MFAVVNIQVSSAKCFYELIHKQLTCLTQISCCFSDVITALETDEIVSGGLSDNYNYCVYGQVPLNNG